MKSMHLQQGLSEFLLKSQVPDVPALGIRRNVECTKHTFIPVHTAWDPIGVQTL